METRGDSLVRELRRLADPGRAAELARFFKTGPGQYGEGDVFLGLTVPQTRAAIRPYRNLPLAEISELLARPEHEIRLAGWLLLAARYADAEKLPDGDSVRREAFRFYLAHAARANNWDLVDASAPNVVGAWLVSRGDWSPLRRLARSANLWERRIAVLATFAFIRAGNFAPALEMCEILLGDRHDLIHKACGWMLREAGKRGGLAELRAFLARHAGAMPRTMLRYALERLDPDERRRWMETA